MLVTKMALGLIVDGAARMEVAVFLDERERIARPVFALGLDHVQVRKQDQRAFSARALQARYEIALLRSAGRHEQLHVSVGEAGGFQVDRHLLRRQGTAAHGIGGISLDQLPVNRAQFLLLGRRHLGRSVLAEPDGCDHDGTIDTCEVGHGNIFRIVEQVS